MHSMSGSDTLSSSADGVCGKITTPLDWADKMMAAHSEFAKHPGNVLVHAVLAQASSPATDGARVGGRVGCADGVVVGVAVGG